mgnify:CR=1 FL=1
MDLVAASERPSALAPHALPQLLAPVQQLTTTRTTWQTQRPREIKVSQAEANGDADDKPEEEPLPEGATEVLYINNLNERIKLPSPSPPSPLEPILERPALTPEPSPQS